MTAIPFTATPLGAIRFYALATLRSLRVMVSR